MARVGTSGWNYRHWRGVFYPPELRQREWFAYYAREFDTVEINNSFYRLPAETTFPALRKQAPRGFCYAVKASRYLTHMKKLKDPRAPLKLFFERARKLKQTLGPVLYQLPPRWRVNAERFETFLKALPKGQAHVVEFRDQSWLIEPIFALLEAYGVGHCVHDLLDVPRRATARTAYLRLHGREDHEGGYTPAALRDWAKTIRAWEGDGRQVWVYFNNDVGGHAIEDARALKQLLG